MDSNVILDDVIKMKLGHLIREVRKYKYQQTFNSTNLANPYTKENVCIGICHANTLGKLETEIVKKDLIYHSILSKLDLTYSVSQEQHELNTILLTGILSNEMLSAIEYKDNQRLLNIHNKIKQLSFENDCINQKNQQLMQLFIDYMIMNKLDSNIINLLEGLLSFYDHIFKCLVYHLLGIYYLDNKKYDLAKQYLIIARDEYNLNNINLGIIYDDIIRVFEFNNNYLEAVQICSDIEDYYNKTKNYKRLIHVYSLLINYFLMTNGNDQANHYYNSAIKLTNTDPDLKYNISIINYNWALKHFKGYEFEESLKYALISYENSIDNENILEVIILLLILYTKLKTDNNIIINLIQEGKKYLESSAEANQLLLRYFIYKFENKDYYRKFASDKILPFLRKYRDKNEFLAFIFEDLYDL